jgi:hypothetical protein
MVDINDFFEEKLCHYKDRKYLVRDNGAVLRIPKEGKRTSKWDNVWTFGVLNKQKGYFDISGVAIHRIVAYAFLGEPPTKDHVVDHIDTNRKNNRPSNLRWITRLENVVLNEVTRKKIEYKIGTSIFDFLENPSKFRHLLEEPNFNWMRTVTEEEAKSCLENVQMWSKKKSKTTVTVTSGISEWIYKEKVGVSTEISATPKLYQEPEISATNITDSLTPKAKQKDWKTPTKFLCCPQEIDGEPIKCYFNELKEDKVFSTNRFGDSTIKKYAITDEDAIIVVTSIPSSIMPFALLKITYENGYYLHTSFGTFMTEEGADKQFSLAQGLEWTGGDSIDDYI